MSSKSRLAAFLFTILTVISACNTIEGAGKDIEKGGEAIQEMSDDVQDEM
tara:strand:- start:704 stop:853 length:150 start_codon:yes stop_codon:yes gene_type:complete